METYTHEFDFLIKWALLPDADLEQLINDESISILQRAAEMLGDQIESKVRVQSTNFVTVVREMKRRYTDGSKLLGKAILEASEWLERNQTEKARQVYEIFLETCVSDFYRKIAVAQLEKLK